MRRHFLCGPLVLAFGLCFRAVGAGVPANTMGQPGVGIAVQPTDGTSVGGDGVGGGGGGGSGGDATMVNAGAAVSTTQQTTQRDAPVLVPEHGDDDDDVILKDGPSVGQNTCNKNLLMYTYY